jgi:hypothetical protein
MKMKAWLLVAGLVGAGALAQEIGYIETFSLATNREAALKELVPGTDEYFYFHALQAQNTGQTQKFLDVIERWKRERRGNINGEMRELLNRQALLDFGKEPQKSLDYLKKELNLKFNHARKTGERRSDAPTKLDESRISAETLLKRALQNEPQSLERIENAGLELTAGQQLTPDQRRNLLSRLARPDYPGVVDLIVADLNHLDSRGFGSLNIHRRLTQAQMDELLQKRPALRNEVQFVNTYLARLAPENEADLETDAAAREAHLARVWAFVQTLDPVHNSLKACVLFNRLRHDQKAGVHDHDRFLAYVKLPRNVWYLRDEVRQRLTRGDHLAQLHQNFGFALPPVGNEEPLVREFLLHFFREAADYKAYLPLIRDDFLKRTFAEAKIVNGVGDPQQWASLLAPEEYKRLKERVDIDFAPDNREVFGSGDAVKLTAFVKNVPSLLVKVYEINTLNYYRETGQPLNLAINLDGLVASSEQRAEYKETPERRVVRTFEFPQLAQRGVYVVELIGNGKSSRALVQKGRLGLLQEVTAGGHAFTVLDEANQKLADARAWFGGREFTPEKDGRIVVPFSTAPKSETVIVQQGGFASLVRFAHLAETYDLRAGIYVDRESLVRREKAQVVLRPVLRVSGQPTSLKLLEEVRLVIKSEDIQGTASEKEIPLATLREDTETVQDIAVPENMVSLTVTLKAKIQNVSLNKKQDLSDAAGFTLNGIDRTAAVQDLHASRTAAGYIVELRGKNGEPRPGEPVFCVFKHRCFRDEVNVELKTDEQGRIWLGNLPGLDWFRVREPAGSEHQWWTARGACTYADALHSKAGEVLRVALVNGTAAAEASLLEVRRGHFVKDWNSALAVAGGFLELRALPAGDYSLYLKKEQREVSVRVTQGEERDGFVFSARRALERPKLAPLHVAAVIAGADAVDIQLANASSFARVHVLATRYLPAYDAFARLGYTGTPGLRQQPWKPTQTFYESGRDIGDEYRYILDRRTAKKLPGNMLERPGLLLNPWALRDTSAELEQLAAGAAYGGRVAGLAEAEGRGGLAKAAQEGAEPPEGYAALDFLKQPAVMLLNLKADKEGRVRIPRAELKGKPHLRIIAVDPTTTVLQNIALDDSPVETRELRLAAGLDPAKTYAEQKIVTPVQPKAALEIADATTAQFETYDTVAKAYRLLSTLAGNMTFTEFGFVARWPDLDAKEKQRLYSKYACHELSFFLQKKDPEFFRTVIAPYLKNKKDKTFLDHWLLGDDLKGYLEPWRFGRLNMVERILLGKRLKEQEASVARDARDQNDLIPPNMEDFNRRFDTAVQTSALETGAADEAGGGVRDQLKRLSQKRSEMKEKQLADLGAVVGFATTTAAPAAPPAAEPMAAHALGLQVANGAVAMDAAAKGQPEMMRKSLASTRLRRAGADRQRALEGADKDVAVEEAVFFEAAKSKREESRRFFQKLDQTKEWAENNYYNLPIEQQLAGLVGVNAFWADYAAHDGKTPFLSKHFPQATRNFTELMLALAVFDLPFKAGAHAEKVEGLRYRVQAATPLVLFHREIREATRAPGNGAVLVAQNFFRADDRYRDENNERYDKFVTDEFLPHVVYGAQIILTNPTGNRQRLQVLLQIPLGAIPVNGGFQTRGTHVALEPHSTQTIEYYFYFPQTGKYPHYPVTIARNDQVVAGVMPFIFNVVASLSKVDKTSWAWLSQNGTPEEVIEFLKSANLHRVELKQIAWRMKDAAYFKQATALLETRHVYDHTLWSYGLQHGDAATIRAYLQHSPFAGRCGLWLASPLLTLDPVERRAYQHLEYAPLVNPRAHQVGAKPKILNNRFREQYQRLAKVLSYKPALSAVDQLAVAYYMALQDRVSEALDWFARVDRKAVPEQVQCDYLDAYLAFYRGDLEGARKIAKRYTDLGVDRWRNRFALVLAQLDEAAGAAAGVADRESRDQAQAALAATEPALELQVEAGRIRLDYRNLKGCTLNFYPMDIELLFSRSPFLQEGSAQFSYIRPVMSKLVELPAGKDSTTIELPVEFRAKNVMVEVLGAGLRKTQAYYANTLKVQVIETYGQIAVTHAETHKPVPAAYVKVYARTKGGEVKFFKDGYTDLRGRFDYASLNTNELEDAAKLAVLVMSETLGAVVRETVPPKR